MIYSEAIAESGCINDSVDAEYIRGNNPNIQTNIIARIQAACPIFASVGGAAALQAFVNAESVSLPTPAAYVIPVAGAAGDQGAGVGYRQVCTDTFGVIIALDNSQDVRGQTALDQIDNMKWQLIGAVCNWKPDPLRSPRGCMFSDWSIIDMDGARVWVQFNFDYEYQITDIDVYHYDGQPLTKITGQYRGGSAGFNIT